MSNHPFAHIDAQWRAAEQLLAGYTGDMPFPAYLKIFFRENPRFGARDRRRVSAFCYAFFRLGRALEHISLRERILAGFFFCADDAAAAFEILRPEWVIAASGDLDVRITWLQQAYPGFSLHQVFPLSDQVSVGIAVDRFVCSHFAQPDLFIRIRPGKRDRVLRSLDAAGIAHRIVGEHALAFDNATNLECLGPPDRDYVVQDLSSQGTASLLPEQPGDSPLVWDACAGSGGKSIMISDHYEKLRLFVSDIRPSILSNLQQRFQRAGIRAERMQVIDLADPASARAASLLPGAGADCIIADVPCSGSGTWGREPWMLSRFTLQDLEGYTAKQRAILAGVVPHLKPGGYLLYMTCSAYAMENEMMAAHIASAYGLTCEVQGVLEGYESRADTMYAARFRRRL
jgi:16S rRNA (cytosine967-C5)-methyltransferase